MPIAHIYILEGRTSKQKEDLITKVSTAIAKSLSAPVSSVRIIVSEMPEVNFGIGGQPASKVKKQSLK